MKALDIVTRVLIIVGGLNWGMVGIAKFDLVATVFGVGSTITNVVYILVGAAALIQLFLIFAPKENVVHARAH